MLCVSIGKRTLENIFVENRVCNICFELQEIVIGYEKHFIVHEENYIQLVPFLQFDEFIFVENLEFEVLEILTHLGRLIIIGDNNLLCKNFHRVKSL